MYLLTKLFSCEESSPELPPLAIHKTVSEPALSEDLEKEAWIRKTEDVHCSFDYKLMSLLGQGGGGKVFLAEMYDPESQKLVGQCALKALSKSKLEVERNYKKYLLLEKKVHAEVKSNFILRFIESFQTKSSCYISFEFAKNGTVSSCLPRHKRAAMKDKMEDLVKFVAACVFMGLKSLHDNDFVYRDLKPENLLVMSDGYVKLADFGLVEEVSDHGIIKGSKAGTFHYLAPEMQLRLGHNKLVDLWCFGVLLHELFTGTTPFTDTEIKSRSFKEIAKTAERGSRFYSEKIPVKASDLISKLLKADKDERLGAQSFEDIKNHEFFEGMDWDALSERKLPSPFLQFLQEEECVKSTVGSQGYISTDDEEERMSHRRVSTFTAEGSPAKRRLL